LNNKGLKKEQWTAFIAKYPQATSLTRKQFNYRLRAFRARERVIKSTEEIYTTSAAPSKIVRPLSPKVQKSNRRMVKRLAAR
jgi:hypothetical protein